MRARLISVIRFFLIVSLGALSASFVGGAIGASTATAQAVKPWFLLLVDTSGSMCGTSAVVTNSCGFPGSIKMNAAKCAIQNIINQTGDAEFGLGQFSQNQDCSGGTSNDTAAAGFMRIAISPTGAASIMPLVDGSGAPAGTCNGSGTSIATGNNTLELCSGGATPTSGALRMVQDYFQGNLAGFTAPTEVDDTALGCRPMNVIVLTDGMSNGGGNPADRADELLNDMRVPTEAGETCPGAAGCVPVPIRTYSIGFGITAPFAEIENIATSGGTDNTIDGTGGLRGYYAGDEAELSEALARIIFDSQLNEVCNGIDDDCDSRVDEDSQAYCDADGIRSVNPTVPVSGAAGAATANQSSTVSVLGAPSNLQTFTCDIAGSLCSGMTGSALITCCADTMSCCDVVPGDSTPPSGDYGICVSPVWAEKDSCDPNNRLCTSPGEICDGADNDCDGETDESPLIGTIPPEICGNTQDDDCDGDADEGCGSCISEICNNMDDDCDAVVDEDLFVSCGFDLGSGFPDSICEQGQRTCVRGQWGAVCPSGVTSGASCSVSVPDSQREIGDPFPTGWQGSASGVGFGTCVTPVAEACDGLDNNCNTLTDDLPATACTTGTIPLGMLPRGICRAGTQSCDPDEPDLLTDCQFEVLPTIEVCNALDDDCDGFTDEAPGVNPTHTPITRPCGTNAGICVAGTETCNSANGTFGACMGSTGPQTEVCDRVVGAPDQTLYDQDCDSRIDETDPAIPGSCVPGAGGAPQPPGPNANTGECNAGSVQCIEGDLQCVNFTGPADELCDNLDQDCNGSNTNGVGPTTGNPNGAAGTDPSLGLPCFPDSYSGSFPDAISGLGTCTPGRVVCDTTAQDTTCVNFGTPSTEICDGIDNDCDGATDENVYDASDTCQTTPPHSPPREFCGRCVSAAGNIVVCRESLVDDLDGSPMGCTDLGYGAPSAHGSVADCCDAYQRTSSWDQGNLIGMHNGEGLCELGRLECIGGAPLCDGEVAPVDELCDGADNDCDGEIDEFVPAVGQPCGNATGECTQGNYECMGVDGLECIGNTTGGDELCDGLDNDCDGFYDEMNPEGGADCGGNTDMCMRRVDPSNTTQPETVPCGDCAFGVEVCVTLFDGDNMPIGAEIQCLGDTGPRPETCDGRDNDCDSKCLVDEDGDVTCPPDIPDADEKIDEDVEITDPNVGEDCGEDEGECEAGSLVCTGGGLVCQGGLGPSVEECNGLDDDCDGIEDDGIPVGAPCGSDVGECSPGMLVCDPELGETVCQGGIGPSTEICDALDNDCDDEIDEGLGVGEECGSDEGECETGVIQCVAGQERCVGETRPSPEICDCADNDCDGEIDEGSNEDLCGGGAACVMCQCALPCTPADEFAARCPQGKAPIEEDDGCYCVGELCKLDECAAETLESQGSVACAPESEEVGSCVCKNNECTFRCAGVVCQDPLVCDPTDGRCREATCLLEQFACDDGERCAYRDQVFTCVDDACADVSCDDNEACVAGECVPSCARVSCEIGERCMRGECVEDRCGPGSGTLCEPGEVCNPDNGECIEAMGCVGTGCSDGLMCDVVSGDCVESICLDTRCPRGETCDSETGECALRCAGDLIFCGEGCINPQSSREYCGAADDCIGDNAGQACADGLACSRGQCSESCADGLVNCGGDCIDPQTDALHCGASADCSGANDGDICQTGSSCRAGKCERNAGPDGSGGSGAGDDVVDGTRVIASGGGGCTCSVPGASQHGSQGGSSKRGALALGLVGLALALLGRRKRFLTPSQVLLGGIVLGALFGSGCKVDTFCLDCEDPNAPDDGDNDGGNFDPGNPTSGSGGSGAGGAGAGGSSGSGAGGSSGSSGDGGMGDASVCVDMELCNGIDDDCDDKIDEGADATEVGIDVQTDVLHCGGCGQACAIPHAFNRCVDGACEIDPTQNMGGCDVGYVNLDGEDDNGCEYRCSKTSDEDTECDLVDNDCDGTPDDDVEFETDINNCGSCGFTCRFANAQDGSTCVDGDCVLDASQCDEGFRDLDGRQENGCERRCQVFPTVDETCNLQDDDCDGNTDEGVAATDPQIGTSCGTDEGECVAGTRACVGGDYVCQGETRSSTEVCNGDDDDCDGNTDESDPQLASNPACGSSVGACERGVLQCVNGDRECGGPTFVGPTEIETCNFIDDDCDGLTDEDAVIDDAGTMRALADGIACSTRSGSLDITPATDAVGLCEYGTLACNALGVLECREETLPAAEQCDNLDHDCDGTPVPANLANLTDPQLGEACTSPLGICALGEPGEWECVNTGSSGSPNWQKRCGMNSVQPEAFETCDNEDDDCDGRFNESAAGTGANNCHLVDNDDDGVRETYVAGALDTGECDSGDTFCVGGSFACIGYTGPRNETCNGLDDDCDGDIDEDAQFEDTPCNVLSGTVGSTDTWDLFGVCTAGTWTCPASPTTAAATGLQCIGGVRPAMNETCNNLDDDCDGPIDEGWVGSPAQGTSCCPNDPSTPHVDMCNAVGAAFASCRPGSIQCAGGSISCVQTSFSPSTEACDLVAPQRDNDCDGQIDEGYDTDTRIDHCGACGNDCRVGGNQIANAIMTCDDGDCVIAACESNFYDNPASMAEDCSLFCPFFAGDIELCDGEDNDCDGVADEAADLTPPPAATFCDQDGACSGAVPVCDEIGSGVFGWTCDRLPAAADTCTFTVGNPGVSNVDEDCDGRIDEGVTIKAGFEAGPQGVGVGKSCRGPGEGDCQVTNGVQVCDSGTPSRTTCMEDLTPPLAEVTENTAARDDEVCDGEDNDCDGFIDEPCSDAGGTCMPNDSACITANTSGGVLGCVIDDYAQLDSDTWIYQYEASRPDAQPGAQGSSVARACSDGNRRPWTNISYEDAVSACEAAGARLCTRSEWRQACSCGGTGSGSAPNYDYGWPGAAAGTCTTSTATATSACNIADSGGAIDAGGANSTCFVRHAAHATFRDVFDLSGNVKELTLAQNADNNGCDPSTESACRIQSRGGASNNTVVGSACGYSNSYWPNAAPFYNVGFRCCSGPNPQAFYCTTIAKTGLPVTVANGGTHNSTITMPNIGSVSRVRVLNLVGDHTGNDMDDADLFLIAPSGSSVTLFNDRCDGDDDWAMRLQDGSTSVSDGGFCSGNTVGGSASTAWAPATAFSTLNGQTSAGTWTLRVTDDDSGGGSGQLVLQSWTLEVCTAPQ